MEHIIEYENFMNEAARFHWILDGEKEVEVRTTDGKLFTTFPRYAVVNQKARRGKGQIIDQGNDLEALLKKYDIKDDEIYDAKGNKIVK